MAMTTTKNKTRARTPEAHFEVFIQHVEPQSTTPASKRLLAEIIKSKDALIAPLKADREAHEKAKAQRRNTMIARLEAGLGREITEADIDHFVASLTVPQVQTMPEAPAEPQSTAGATSASGAAEEGGIAVPEVEADTKREKHPEPLQQEEKPKEKSSRWWS